MKYLLTIALITFLAYTALAQECDGTVSNPSTVTVNPSFDANALPSTVCSLYNRVTTQMNDPMGQWPYGIDHELTSPPNATCTYGTDPRAYGTYTFARRFHDYVVALINTISLTGDPAVLAEIYRLMQLVKAELADHHGRGYPYSRYAHPSGQELYCQEDTHIMDEGMTVAMLAHVAYVFRQNETMDPAYAEEADFWVDYMENNWDPKWQARRISCTTTGGITLCTMREAMPCGGIIT